MLQFWPLDNTDYTAEVLGAWTYGKTRGVYPGNNHFHVTANGSMTVTISPGIAHAQMDEFYHGFFLLLQEENITLTPPANTPAANYGITLQVDKLTQQRRIVLKESVGALPEPEHSDLYEELIVAVITLRRGQTSITAQHVTDTRMNEKLCGVVKNELEELPTQMFYDAWWDWFSQIKAAAEEKADAFLLWIDAFKTQSEDDWTQWFESFTRIHTETVNDWRDLFFNSSEEMVKDWFKTLQDELNENQAANLANMIDNHKKDTILTEGGIHGMRIQNGWLQFASADGWARVVQIPQGWSFNYLRDKGHTYEKLRALGVTYKDLRTLVEVED